MEYCERGSGVVQVYLILDEFIMGGEIQETSKKVRLGHCYIFAAHQPSLHSSSCTCSCASSCWGLYLLACGQVILERLSELERIET